MAVCLQTLMGCRSEAKLWLVRLWCALPWGLKCCVTATTLTILPWVCLGLGLLWHAPGYHKAVCLSVLSYLC
jgi:hypothetical protein